MDKLQCIPYMLNVVPVRRMRRLVHLLNACNVRHVVHQMDNKPHMLSMMWVHIIVHEEKHVANCCIVGHDSRLQDFIEIDHCKESISVDV